MLTIVPTPSDLADPAPRQLGSDVDDRRAVSRLVHPSSLEDTVGSVSPDVLAAIATGLASTARATELEFAEGEPRAFGLLLATPVYEAWLIGWRPDAMLGLHDHGACVGAVHVLEGELIETYTDLGEQHPLRTHALAEGDTISIPLSRVHEVANLGSTRALSIHVYSPPLSSMTFFDDRLDHFLEPVHTVDP